MGEYILRPRSHNFESGREYDDANHKTNLAYDNDPDTYWLATSSHSAYSSSSQRMLYNFDFDKIPNGENIVGAKLSVTYISDWGTTEYRMAKAVSLLEPSYSNALGSFWHPINTPKGEIKTRSKDLNTTGFEDSLEYIQNNISLLRAGSAAFGVWIGVEATSSQPYKLYDISLTVYTEETTKIFLGETPVTRVYLGNTLLTGINLGDKKLL